VPLVGLYQHYARHDDGRLGRLAATCGCSGVDALGERIEALLAELDLAARLRLHLRDRGQVLALTSEMFTPGRADNSFVPLDEPALVGVLTASLATIGM
jgi:hypothetical protein